MLVICVGKNKVFYFNCFKCVNFYGVDIVVDLIWVICVYYNKFFIIVCLSLSLFFFVRKFIENKWFVRCILDKCKCVVFFLYNILLYV